MSGKTGNDSGTVPPTVKVRTPAPIVGISRGEGGRDVDKVYANPLLFRARGFLVTGPCADGILIITYVYVGVPERK